MIKNPLPSPLFSRRLLKGITSVLAVMTVCSHTPALVAGTTEAKDKVVVEKKAESRIKFSAFLEGGFTASTGNPKDNQLFGRLFDDRNAEPLLNQATVNIERALAPEPGKIDYGFKLQLSAGSDARFTDLIGEFDRTFNGRYTVAVVEAYGSFHLPVLTEGGLDIRLGQFATPLGIETIDPRNNFFYSHTYLFNFGPFQHLGGVLTLHVNKVLDIYAGVTRGVNIGLDDNNDVLSYLGGFALTLLDGKLVIAGSTSIGPENDAVFQGAIGNNGNSVDTNGDNRYYGNINVTFKPTDKWTFLTDSFYTVDTGFQAEYYGISQFAGYTLNKYVSVGVRGEVFRDDDGFYATQFAKDDDAVDFTRGSLKDLDPRTVGTGGGTTIIAATVGVNVKPIDHVLIRPELRYDKAIDGRQIFTDSTQSHQFTGGLDVLITF